MKCLVAIVDPERDRAVVDLAVALAAGEELILVSAIEVPEGDTLASVQPEARRLRRTLDQLVPANARARTLVTVARQGWQAIRETVANERPDLLLLSWRRPGVRTCSSVTPPPRARAQPIATFAARSA